MGARPSRAWARPGERSDLPISARLWLLCGRVRCRAGFEHIPAVRHGALKEVKSTIILQPGPAALTDGLNAIAEIIRAWASHQPAAADKAP